MQIRPHVYRDVARGPLQPNPSPLHFEGLTRSARKAWMTGDTFSQKAERAPHGYVGGLPEVLRTLGLPPQSVLETLDQLNALILMSPDEIVGMTFRLGDAPVELSLLGSGAYGVAFRIEVKGQSLVLKSYRDKAPVRSGRHGRTHELATATYLSGQRYKDLAAFYVGNVQRGWGIFEYIADESELSERRGKRLSQRLDVKLQDNHGQNRRGEVWVDYGGIIPKGDVEKIAEERLVGPMLEPDALDESLPEQVSGWIEAASRSEEYPNVVQALKAVPMARQKEALSKVVEGLWPQNPSTATRLALSFPDHLSVTVDCLYRLPEDRRIEEMRRGFADPACRKALCDYLSAMQGQHLQPDLRESLTASPETVFYMLRYAAQFREIMGYSKAAAIEELLSVISRDPRFEALQDLSLELWLPKAAFPGKNSPRPMNEEEKASISRHKTRPGRLTQPQVTQSRPHESEAPR